MADTLQVDLIVYLRSGRVDPGLPGIDSRRSLGEQSESKGISC